MFTKKRFDGKHDNQTIINFNIMIDAIKQYKKLSNSDKILIGVNWIEEEAKDRNLPFRKFPGYDLNSIYNCIINENYYANVLLLDDCNLEICDPIYLLPTINLLCNRYSDVFPENLEVLSRCCASLFILEDIYKKHYFSRKMLKKTYKLLNNIVDNIPHEDLNNYQKVIKKTEK